MGFPIAEMHEDGSFVITKHEGTGGLVSVGTVTAQLLYEIQGQRYFNPDAVARFDTIRLSDDGPDRVRVSGIRGEAAPPETKVCINYLGGYKNSVTFVLTGIDIEAKAKLAEDTLWQLLGGRENFDEADAELIRSDRSNPGSNEDAMAYLRITVKDNDKAKVGRAFSNKAVEMVLANYPGFFVTTPPKDASPFGVYWPTLIPSELIEERVMMEGKVFSIDSPSPQTSPEVESPSVEISLPPSGECRSRPLGTVFGARSGDKGGNANIGVWAKTPAAYAWIEAFLTIEKLKDLLPETRDLTVERCTLANIFSLNFVVQGLLGDGVAASTRSDPQAKGLGEYLRAKIVDIPALLLDAAEE